MNISKKQQQNLTKLVSEVNNQLAKIREFPELRYLTYSYEWAARKQEEIMDTMGLTEEDILNLLHEATKK